VGCALFITGCAFQQQSTFYWVLTNNIIISSITIVIFIPQTQPISLIQLIGAAIAYPLMMYGLPALSKAYTHRLPISTSTRVNCDFEIHQARKKI
jgi:hypothetical protein